jgi:hypothetical protein
MRNPSLHSLLQEFIADAGLRLTRASAEGDQIPFEVIETDTPHRSRVPLYCYRPLTEDFINARRSLLAALPSYAPAIRALASAGAAEAYLHAHGERLVSADARERAEATLLRFVARVFDDRNDFGFDGERFAQSYAELEQALYKGRCVTEVIAPLRGLDLDEDTAELDLGDGLALVRPGALVGPPSELTGATLLIALHTAHERSAQPPVAAARSRFRRMLTALRLFEPGGYAIGPSGYSRVDGGAWTPVAIGHSGRPRLVTRIARDSEDELRAFINLVSRRVPSGPDASGSGELAWALARFEMGCERLAPFEALTDYLLAARALLEPEGPSSGRLAQRLAVICAPPAGQAQLAERTAHAISLERAVIAGLAAASSGVDALVDELAEHLRAILRDVICGHLDVDVRRLADDLLTEAAGLATAVA